jgi:hypothetical protein
MLQNSDALRVFDHAWRKAHTAGRHVTPPKPGVCFLPLNFVVAPKISCEVRDPLLGQLHFQQPQ